MELQILLAFANLVSTRLVNARFSTMSSVPAAPRRQRLSADERKAAIVKAAVRLFAEKGFRGTTTRELAAAVGVSEPVLYQHFATKGDLYSAIIESICRDEDTQRYAGIYTARDAGDDRAFFTHLGEAILAWYEEQPEIIRLLLYSALEGHELKDRFFERQITVLYELLNDYIGRRIEEGAFRRMDPYLAARVFTGMFAHQGQAKTVFGIDDLKGSRAEIAAGIVEIFLRGMQKQGASRK